ncbi:hypothetical protein LY76DRAFT_608911 [Colletotrichum caudatum]|nr:hypothetical protein LY76DRAFT_608911 [Colletotrichum caudatum]
MSAQESPDLRSYCSLIENQLAQARTELEQVKEQLYHREEMLDEQTLCREMAEMALDHHKDYLICARREAQYLYGLGKLQGQIECSRGRRVIHPVKTKKRKVEELS